MHSILDLCSLRAFSKPISLVLSRVPSHCILASSYSIFFICSWAIPNKSLFHLIRALAMLFKHLINRCISMLEVTRLCKASSTTLKLVSSLVHALKKRKSLSLFSPNQLKPIQLECDPNCPPAYEKTLAL